MLAAIGCIQIWRKFRTEIPAESTKNDWSKWTPPPPRAQTGVKSSLGI